MCALTGCSTGGRQPSAGGGNVMTSTSSSKAAQFQATIGAMATAHDPLCCRTCATESFDRASLDCSGGRSNRKVSAIGTEAGQSGRISVAEATRRRWNRTGCEALWTKDSRSSPSRQCLLHRRCSNQEIAAFAGSSQ